MRCERYREKLIEMLLESKTALGDELAAHLRKCSGCDEFYEAQKRLVGAMDAGVRVMMNQEPPASLLAGARGRMAAEPAESRWLGRSLVAAVVACVLFIWAVTMSQRNVRGPVSPPQLSAEVKFEPRSQLATRPPAASRNRRALKQVKAAGNMPDSADTFPKVIVLPEEREAFARFVEQVSADPQGAIALTRAAPPRQDLPVEIAVLRIAPLKVRLLERTAEE